MRWVWFEQEISVTNSIQFEIFDSKMEKLEITPAFEIGSFLNRPNMFRQAYVFSKLACNSLYLISLYRTSQSQNMSQHFSQPLKVFGECYPNNIYYDQWDNGTYFKSRGYFQLWQFESKIANGIEIVTEISGSSQTHPIVSCKL